MAREHRARHRPLHSGCLLTGYPIAAVNGGPWPGRLALGPVPIGEGDPSAIAAWGADKVIGLTKPDEPASLGMPDLAGHLATAGLAWRNAPIDDFAAPDDRFNQAWPALRDCLLGRLNGGGKVLVHCRAGRGRSGTIVAALLIAGGLAPDDAIGAVRSARPGAIETADQEAWLRQISVSG